jgi:hypothetical protein
MTAIGMGFCQLHWTKLRAAIDGRGLTGFVAKDGQEAAKMMTAGDFEPLMDAHNAIFSHALGAFGGPWEGCPLCGLAKRDGGQSFEVWITYAADEQLERAKRLAAGA